LPPYYAKDPEQQRNYKENPGSFAIQQHSNSPPPDIATGDENERHHELKKPHRTQALVGVAVEKALSGRPSLGPRPNSSSSQILARRRRPASPRVNRARSSHPSSTKSTACLESIKQKASGLTCRRATCHALLYKPRRPRRQRRSKAPPGRGRVRESLFPSAAAAIASPTPPGKASHGGTPSWQTLAPLSTTDGEHNLDLDR